MHQIDAIVFIAVIHIMHSNKTVGIAQMVRALDCGPRGRRFESDYPPHFINTAGTAILGGHRELNSTNLLSND